jgi:hypothetical protein
VNYTRIFLIVKSWCPVTVLSWCLPGGTLGNHKKKKTQEDWQPLGFNSRPSKYKAGVQTTQECTRWIGRFFIYIHMHWSTIISCDNNLISNALHTKFLGLTIRSMLSWRTHIDQLIIKLSTACHVIRSLKPYMSHKTLLSIYHSLFHCHELWNNILGEFLWQYKIFLDAKKSN